MGVEQVLISYKLIGCWQDLVEEGPTKKKILVTHACIEINRHNTLTN